MEAAQYPGQPGIGDRRNDAQPQRAHQPMFGLLGPMFGLGGGGQNVAGLVQKHAPGPGQ